MIVPLTNQPSRKFWRFSNAGQIITVNRLAVPDLHDATRIAAKWVHGDYMLGASEDKAVNHN